MTIGFPSFTTAAQAFVVPRSIPITEGFFAGGATEGGCSRFSTLAGFSSVLAGPSPAAAIRGAGVSGFSCLATGGGAATTGGEGFCTAALAGSVLSGWGGGAPAGGERARGAA